MGRNPVVAHRSAGIQRDDICMEKFRDLQDIIQILDMIISGLIELFLDLSGKLLQTFLLVTNIRFLHLFVQKEI